VTTSPTLIEKCSFIANPVAGNPTHYLIEQGFSQKGLDWRFMSFEFEPPQLPDAMRGLKALGFHGVKVGDPFQESVIEHLDVVTDVAKRCGSVNCVTDKGGKYVGDNTEGIALVDLVRQQITPTGRRATILGSGRLARAISLALADAGVVGITIVTRNATTGQSLADLVKQHTGVDATFTPLSTMPISIESETGVLVNATALGTERPEAKLPIQVDSLGPKMVVADVAYNTARTWLTQQAAERGCRVIDGLSLYVHQTALAFREWTGVMPDTVSMREAAEEFLGI
jgi:shikimate dehydrogenase